MRLVSDRRSRLLCENSQSRFKSHVYPRVGQFGAAMATGLTQTGTPGESHEGLQILVVDDNRDCAQSMAMLLRIYGHQVEIALNGPMALESARVRPPDVVLLDIGLPGMDGWKVAERIKSSNGARKPLLIAVTGFGQDSDRRHSAESGIDLHLLKPIDPEKLNSLLSRLQALRDPASDVN